MILRRAAAAGALAVGLTFAACSEDQLNPVGAGQLPPPDSVVEIVLEPVAAESFETGTADRGFGSLLVAAHDLPTADGFESRILLRFALATRDTAGGPITVDSARVRLLTPDVEPDTVAFRVHRVGAFWEEDEVSWIERGFATPWASPGGDFDPAPLAEGRLAGDSTFFALPDSLVQSWLDDPNSNAGVILLVDTPGSLARVTAATNLGLPSEAGPRLDLFLTVRDTASVSEVLATSDAFIATFEGELVPGLAVGIEPRLRTFVRFDLAPVPDDASINLAELVVTPRQVVTSLDTLTLEVRRVASPFLGAETVFAEVPLDTAVVRSDRELVFSGAGLASLVRAWQADSSFNLGLGLTLARVGPQTEIERRSGTLGFVVLAGPDAVLAERPRLRLIFTPELGSDLGRRHR